MENDLTTYKSIYFLGIGGIGMSALARYFKLKGYQVGGYDKTSSPLTDELQAEGIDIHFEDFGPALPESFRNRAETLVIYTPAIPKNLGEFMHVQHAGYKLLKRSQILGLITRHSRGIGVAGTHGKTTTSTMLAHILHQSSLKCNAFLGGISSNFNSNFVASETSDITVIEADEFDRSFLQLSPYAGVITSTDADHLDIYGDADHVREGFQLYTNLVHPDGILVMKQGLNLSAKAPVKTYGIDLEADFTGRNVRIENGKFFMDVHFDGKIWMAVELGLPGIHNAENALACIALGLHFGLSETEIRSGLQSFKGVKRRFEYQLRSEKLIYIDDYAHHPTEIKALLDSIQLIYPNLPVIGLFQPHLFSRTRDFMQGFAEQLSRVDDLVLLPIYPAREEPIAGITSDALLDLCSNERKAVRSASDAMEYAGNREEGVVLTIGAGDIDRIVNPLRERLQNQLSPHQ